MEIGKYSFAITLEHDLIGIGTAKYSAMGDIVVEREAPRSEIESDLISYNRRKSEEELTKKGYIVSDDEPRTLSFSLKPQ